ncbi:SDR family NAD(P)-dependent oxidoreductase [Actinotalea sp. M2MS4P-6]|uniref:SDR family NAD(P)-dependent oxidoreductase n=1 Tax=Actinotalea sp. M2MS4P-6 TaxID=2983762 RepID=UPI0021E4BEAE|nr:SDR family NAD(P)-dependent oxidoreductase [Actinotalea sp. M2MS4P-6]MCV2395190.1 SDR family NAD(P)-dependent oxidoreductase [Actinotalea sp. M2MS4P-6]
MARWSERVVVLTGATDGLGRALAGRLATDPQIRLVLHGRDPDRLAGLRRELADRPARVDTVRADLADLTQVRRLADDVAAITDRIDVLVNNAGVGAGEPDGTTRRLTVDGNELRFAVNYLAPFALTQRLLPLLGANGPARIVNVASIGQAPIAFDDLTLARDYSGVRAYGQSKLALITYGFSLAARLDPARVTVNSLHPATFMPTKMVLDSVGYSIDSLETGLDATDRLVRGPALDGITGRFYDRTAEARALPDAYDPEIRERLWRISEQLT